MIGCRISLDWTFKGMRTLIMENEYLRVVSLLDKGSDIIELCYKPMDIDMMWHSPMGYRNPSMVVESCPNPTGAFSDFYGGGWQDILPFAGPRTSYAGAFWGEHGETALIPWNCTVKKESSEEVIAYLSARCYRYPLMIDKELILRKKEPILTIREKLTNLSNQDLEFCWLQHPAFGEPLISPGTIIDMPAEEVIVSDFPGSIFHPDRSRWPIITDKGGKQFDLSRIPSRDTIMDETVFIVGFEQGWYAITNPQLKLGFGLTWDKELYPTIWFWQNYNKPDYPWFKQAWNIALEPCTSYVAPFEGKMKLKGVPTIRGNAKIETELKAVVYSGLAKVERITEEGRVQGI